MRVLETCLYADDLVAAEAFYRDILGLELHSKVAGRHLFFKLEGSMLLIFNPQASAKAGDVPSHTGRAGGHACFAISDSELAAWETRLKAHGLSVTRYTWANAEGQSRGDSLYFTDPAGNVLELAPTSIWRL